MLEPSHSAKYNSPPSSQPNLARLEQLCSELRSLPVVPNRANQPLAPSSRLNPSVAQKSLALAANAAKALPPEEPTEDQPGADDIADDLNEKEQLALFQLFTQLYQHHPDLIDRILKLAFPYAPSVDKRRHYVQGIINSHQVYLVSNLCQDQSRHFYAPRPIWILGRDPRQADLAMPDKRLSRCHAAIQYDADKGFMVADLESTNGTYVNGERINRLYSLRDGDHVQLGSLVFYFFTCNQQAPLASSSLPTALSSDEKAPLDPNPILYPGLFESTVKFLRANFNPD